MNNGIDCEHNFTTPKKVVFNVEVDIMNAPKKPIAPNKTTTGRSNVCRILFP